MVPKKIVTKKKKINGVKVPNEEVKKWKLLRMVDGDSVIYENRDSGRRPYLVGVG